VAKTKRKFNSKLWVGLPILALASQLSMAKEVKTSLEKKQPSKIETKLNFRTNTMGFYEGEQEASLVLFGFNPELKFKLDPKFYINANVSLNLLSSRIQIRYLSQNDQNFFLNELSMNYEPMENIKVSVGAINQNHLDSPFLVSNLSFPGIMGVAQVKTEALKFGYKGQRLIPTSTSFDTDRTEKEALPLFQTQGLFADYKVNNYFEVGGQVNYFSFSELPSVVAFESQIMGNDVTGIEIGDSTFTEEFSGYSQSYYAKGMFTKNIGAQLNISIVENENTLDGDNRSQFVETGMTFKFKSFDLIPSYAQFYAEPNVSPAFYNTRMLGNNNREGVRYQLRTNFKTINLNVIASYINAKVLNQSIYQDDLDSARLVMEMLNVKF
jgi:hypothetical protein